MNGRIADAGNHPLSQVPFVMYNVPELDETTRKWQVPGYMAGRLRGRKYHVEIANTSHTQVPPLNTSGLHFCIIMSQHGISAHY
jgi:hypothetical protein